jgi:hypothetical protein
MRKFFLIILIILGSIPVLPGQKLYVIGTDGSQYQYEFSDIAKLHFSPGTLLVSQSGGITDTYPFAGIRHLHFTDAMETPDYKDVNRKHFLLYPNPARDFISLEYKSSINETLRLEILDPAGRMILSEHLLNSSGEQYYRTDISGLAPGFYICRISGNSISMTSKFIKK